MSNQRYIIYTDGGARGNPGPAAIGVVVFAESGRIITSFGKTIGVATNNVAEYQAVIAALNYLLDQKVRPPSITFCLDSAVVTEQLRGTFKIKEPHLRELFAKVRQMAEKLAVAITFTKIPRAKNFLADQLLNHALDRDLQ